MAKRSRFKLIEQLRRNRLSHRQRSRLIRSGAILAGCILLLAGTIMIVTPGPAFLVLGLGFYLLALEFDWAERLLEVVLEKAEQAKGNSFTKSIGRFIKRHPRLSAVGLALFITLVIAFAISIFAPELVTDRL